MFSLLSHFIVANIALYHDCQVSLNLALIANRWIFAYLGMKTIIRFHRKVVFFKKMHFCGLGFSKKTYFII